MKTKGGKSVKRFVENAVKVLKTTVQTTGAAVVTSLVIDAAIPENADAQIRYRGYYNVHVPTDYVRGCSPWGTAGSAWSMNGWGLNYFSYYMQPYMQPAYGAWYGAGPVQIYRQTNQPQRMHINTQNGRYVDERSEATPGEIGKLQQRFDRLEQKIDEIGQGRRGTEQKDNHEEIQNRPEERKNKIEDFTKMVERQNRDYKKLDTVAGKKDDVTSIFEFESRYLIKICDNQLGGFTVEYLATLLRAARYFSDGTADYVPYDLDGSRIGIRNSKNKIVYTVKLADYLGKTAPQIIDDLNNEMKTAGIVSDSDIGSVAVRFRQYNCSK